MKNLTTIQFNILYEYCYDALFFSLNKKHCVENYNFITDFLNNVYYDPDDYDDYFDLYEEIVNEFITIAKIKAV